MRMRLRAPDEPEAESSYEGDALLISAPSTPERRILQPLDVGSPEYIEERLENLKRRPKWTDFLDQYVKDHPDSEDEADEEDEAADEWGAQCSAEAPGFLRSAAWSLLVVGLAPLLVVSSPCLRHQGAGFWPLGCRSLKELLRYAVANVAFMALGLALVYWTICRELPDLRHVGSMKVALGVKLQDTQRAVDMCHSALLQWERTVAQELCMPVGIDGALLLLNACLLLHCHRRWVRYAMVIMALMFAVDMPAKLYGATFPSPEIYKVDPSYALIDEEIVVALEGKNLKPGGSVAWVAYWGCATTSNVDACEKQFPSTFKAGVVSVTFKSLDHFIPCYRDPPNPLKAQEYQCYENVRVRVKDKQSIPGWSRASPQTAQVSRPTEVDERVLNIEEQEASSNIEPEKPDVNEALLQNDSKDPVSSHEDMDICEEDHPEEMELPTATEEKNLEISESEQENLDDSREESNEEEMDAQNSSILLGIKTEEAKTKEIDEHNAGATSTVSHDYDYTEKGQDESPETTDPEQQSFVHTPVSNAKEEQTNSITPVDKDEEVTITAPDEQDPLVISTVTQEDTEVHTDSAEPELQALGNTLDKTNIDLPEEIKIEETEEQTSWITIGDTTKATKLSEPDKQDSVVISTDTQEEGLEVDTGANGLVQHEVKVPVATPDKTNVDEVNEQISSITIADITEETIFSNLDEEEAVVNPTAVRDEDIKDTDEVTEATATGQDSPPTIADIPEDTEVVDSVRQTSSIPIVDTLKETKKTESGLLEKLMTSAVTQEVMEVSELEQDILQVSVDMPTDTKNEEAGEENSFVSSADEDEETKLREPEQDHLEVRADLTENTTVVEVTEQNSSVIFVDEESNASEPDEEDAEMNSTSTQDDGTEVSEPEQNNLEALADTLGDTHLEQEQTILVTPVDKDEEVKVIESNEQDAMTAYAATQEDKDTSELNTYNKLQDPADQTDVAKVKDAAEQIPADQTEDSKTSELYDQVTMATSAIVLEDTGAGKTDQDGTMKISISSGLEEEEEEEEEEKEEEEEGQYPEGKQAVIMVSDAVEDVSNITDAQDMSALWEIEVTSEADVMVHMDVKPDSASQNEESAAKVEESSAIDERLEVVMTEDKRKYVVVDEKPQENKREWFEFNIPVGKLAQAIKQMTVTRKLKEALSEGASALDSQSRNVYDLKSEAEPSEIKPTATQPEGPAKKRSKKRKAQANRQTMKTRDAEVESIVADTVGHTAAV